MHLFAMQPWEKTIKVESTSTETWDIPELPVGETAERCTYAFHRASKIFLAGLDVCHMSLPCKGFRRVPYIVGKVVKKCSWLYVKIFSSSNTKLRRLIRVYPGYFHLKHLFTVHPETTGAEHV